MTANSVILYEDPADTKSEVEKYFHNTGKLLGRTVWIFKNVYNNHSVHGNKEKIVLRNIFIWKYVF